MEFIRKSVKKVNGEKGFSLAEVLIVVLIISILLVIALPQIMASRRALRFSGLQRQISTTLRDARQEAISQRLEITARYDDVNKRMIIYGGKFGLAGTANNQILDFANEGITQGELIYGKPTGAPLTALGDTSNIEPLVGGAADIKFQASGEILDAANNPQNKALFFYDTHNPTSLAFAVSVLGAGGRVKIWKYSSGVNNYVE